MGRVRPVQELHHRGSARKMVEGGKAKKLLRRITLTLYISCASKAALLNRALPLQKVTISWSCYAEDFVYKTPMGLLIICIDARLQEGKDLTNIERLNKN